MTAIPTTAQAIADAPLSERESEAISSDSDNASSRTLSSFNEWYETREYENTRELATLDISASHATSRRVSSLKEAPDALTLMNIDITAHEANDDNDSDETDSDVASAESPMSRGAAPNDTKILFPGDPLLANTAFASVFGWTRNDSMNIGDNYTAHKRVESANIVASSLHSSILRYKVVASSNNVPVWCVAVSYGGQYIATGGQDAVVRIWATRGSLGATHMESVDKEPTHNPAAVSQSSTPTKDVDDESAVATPNAPDLSSPSVDEPSPSEWSTTSQPETEAGSEYIIYQRPYRVYCGHKLDIIDLSWSTSHFLLSASIDSTVRLWHVARNKCLRVFRHSDYVTSIAFHPLHDCLFVSGSFDHIVRLYDIREHRVVQWTQTPNIVTSVAFTPNTGNTVVAGLIDGRLGLYHTEDMKYVTEIDCRNRSGKHKSGSKVTSITFDAAGRRMLVTTNDSRMRLYSTSDFMYLAKFKGNVNKSLQIRGVISPDATMVICGSENGMVYSWNVPESAVPTESYASSATLNTVSTEKSSSKYVPIKVSSTDQMKVNHNIVTATTHLNIVSTVPQKVEESRTMIITLSFDGIMSFYETSKSTATKQSLAVHQMIYNTMKKTCPMSS